jgi:phage/plasmid-like protein (TIGR03299 family)
LRPVTFGRTNAPITPLEGTIMPADIESMFSVRQMPWHEQGTVLPDYPSTWTEARTLAGLDWDPVTGPVYAVTGINPDGTEHYEPIQGWKSIARSDTGAVLSLNKDSYTVIDHGEMGEIIEAVLAQPNVRWETAGVIDGGRAVWCLAYLDEPITIPGDDSPTLPYLAITNRHDGTAACALRATAVRIVCANTFRAAELEGERTGTTFSFIHKASWRNRIDEARRAVTGARTEMQRYTELATELLGIPISGQQRELFITQFIPMPPDGLITDRVARNVEQARNAVRLLFQSTTTEQIAGTAYGLVQAAGEYLDHVRTARTWETRLNRTLMRPEPLKHRALALVREITAA